MNLVVNSYLFQINKLMNTNLITKSRNLFRGYELKFSNILTKLLTFNQIFKPYYNYHTNYCKDINTPIDSAALLLQLPTRTSWYNKLLQHDTKISTLWLLHYFENPSTTAFKSFNIKTKVS